MWYSCWRFFSYHISKKLSYVFAFVVIYQASIGHVQLRGKVQEGKQNLVGLQGDDTSENQPQEINLRIPTTLRFPLWSSIPSPPLLGASCVAPNEEPHDIYLKPAGGKNYWRSKTGTSTKSSRSRSMSMPFTPSFLKYVDFKERGNILIRYSEI